MNAVTALPLKDLHQEAKDKVAQFLEEAKKIGLVDCVLIGSLPGNRYQVAVSDTMNRAELIGNIELAKLEMYFHSKEE
jgi:hypothetical protein